MTAWVLDDELVKRLRAQRATGDGGKHDEVWVGVHVVSPLPDIEHQRIATSLATIFGQVLPQMGEGNGYAVAGLNVSDREEGWTENYREPDVAVILSGNPGKDCDTHWYGGPDLVVEVLSPNDVVRQKRPFYAGVGVRELLAIDRAPWRLELYRLEDGVLAPAGVSSVEQPDVLESAVLPLRFRIVTGGTRPEVGVISVSDGRVWRV